MAAGDTRIPSGADTGTRDGGGRRQGGEQTGHDEPHSTAVWGAVLGMVAGFTVAGLAIPFTSWVMFIVGLAVFAVSGLGSLGLGIMRHTH